MSVFVSIEAMIMVGKDVNEKVKNEKEEEKELDKEVENGI